MPRCVCGNHYSEHKYLRRHEGSCPKVKERSKRIWSVIKKVNTEESRSKRRHAEWDLAECGESSNLDRFMGRIKRKKPNRGLEAEGGNESFGGPSSSIAHDDLRSMTPPIICGVDVADSRCGSGDAVDANSDCDFHSSLPHMAPSSDTLPPKRIRRRTERAMAMLEDTVPEGPGDLLSDDETTNTTPQSDSEQHPPLRIRIRRVIRSVANKFGLVRIYHGRPSGVPKSHRDDFTADDLHSRPRSHTEHPPSEGRSTVAGIISPYPNISAFLFNRWHWNSGKKTKKGRTEFLEDVIGHKDFKIEDIRGINFDRIDDMLVENPGGATDGNGWRTSAVPIHIPTGKKETKSSRREAAYRQRQDRAGESDGDSQPETEYATGRQYSIPDLHYRNLVDVVKEVCSGAASENFHWHPFEEHWEPPWEDRSTERVYGDLFTSSAFLDADRDLHNLPPEPDCDLPRAIAALMFYSDATHVAQFGQAKLWPIYAYFGNQSKYERGRPSARAGHSVAFLPSLPDSVTDFIRDDPSGKITGPLLAHCRRELFHGCWKIILDEEFLHAYEHGIIVDCGDGVRRRIYPRIFTYSADYPEKVLIATIRDMGQCPCPRCKIKKDEIREFASASDMEIRHTKLRIDDEDRRANVHAARSLIYDKGYVVNSAHVEDLLKECVLVAAI
ncbi:hypothetical protein BD779DRAFT_483736 [Infundibulicybe gibba]|nr:hypothetical protein BD779DRAFT_483736 [Infundibulicybe gibba]